MSLGRARTSDNLAAWSRRTSACRRWAMIGWAEVLKAFAEAWSAGRAVRRLEREDEREVRDVPSDEEAECRERNVG